MIYEKGRSGIYRHFSECFTYGEVFSRGHFPCSLVL